MCCDANRVYLPKSVATTYIIANSARLVTVPEAYSFNHRAKLSSKGSSYSPIPDYSQGNVTPKPQSKHDIAFTSASFQPIDLR